MAEHRVDAPWRQIYVPRARSGGLGVASGLVLVSMMFGCAGARPGEPVPDARLEEVARAARQDTRLREPVRIIFAWELNESGSRLHGRGVARLEPPYRARLDLFTENGETAARAALVDEDLRIPPEVDRRLIPTPPLLWTSLGVFHPGDGAIPLNGRSVDGEVTELRYRTSDDEELRYELRNRIVVAVERLRDGRAVERVRLDPSENGRFPDEATYRDLTAFRELTVTLQSIERVEPHPSDIWHPAR